MADISKTNISADLARLLNNNRQTLGINPKFSIIGVQIALKDEFIQEIGINKGAVIGLMAGMISFISNVDSGLDNTNLLKAIQKAAVKISQDPSNAKLTQEQAITLGKAWVDKTTQKALLNNTLNSIEDLTSILMHNKPFNEIVTPKFQHQIQKALHKSDVQVTDKQSIQHSKDRTL
ncbi:MAG: hypothetical protein AB8U25_05245 [Rickettsiales endosymbiont of Dermacentor nuttalli]